VYFEGSPPAEEPSGVMMRALPQFYMFLQSHEFYFFNETGKEEIKRELFYIKGGSCTHVFS
jgi:hypothetical protein